MQDVHINYNASNNKIQELDFVEILLFLKINEFKLIFFYFL